MQAPQDMKWLPYSLKDQFLFALTHFIYDIR